jgi:hypothetical protein
VSWPADGLPRFKAVSEAQSGHGQDVRSACGYVYDRAYCHEIVARFPAGQERHALAFALLAAERLEREHATP